MSGVGRVGRIAREDLREAWRDRTLLALTVLFGLVGLLGGYILAEIAGVGLGQGEAFAVLVLQLMSVLLPLVAVGITYDSIVGRRANGSLKLLLGLPYLRGDVLLGTYIGRAIVVTIIALVASLAMALGGLVFGAGTPAVGVSLQAIVLVVILGVTFTGLGLAISGATESTTLAALLAFLLTVALVFMWGLVITGLVWIVNGFTIQGAEPAWATFLQAINPANAYKALASLFVPSFEGMATLTNGETFYQTSAFAGLVLLVWVTVVPLAGYLRFRGADL